MIILTPQAENSMKRVVRLLLQPSFWVSLSLLSAPFLALLIAEEAEDYERVELQHEPAPLYATSPGHTVFGEYVGAHWCPPCMNSASPSLTNLKSSNPEDFTYVSFFESDSGGWPSDSPINRHNHLMSSSSGYPTFSFADSQSAPCYKVGAAGSNYYDGDFSNGGCMSSQSSDFELSLSMVLNSTSGDVAVTLEAIYTGPEASIVVYVYGAITEKIGADSYDNGVRPGHNWRGWLLNSANTGFQQLSLVKDTWSEHTWTTPLSQVRGSSGLTQWENFWPVLALMDGPHSTYNDFFVAIDPDMGPMVDVGISDFTLENRNLMDGFIPGDILDLSLEVTNNGVEAYSSGGSMGVYLISGLEELLLEEQPIGTLDVSGSKTLQMEFDTSEIEVEFSGVSTFRARLNDLGGDRNSSNNIQDQMAPHDLPPTPSQPAATGTTTFERGDKVTFEVSAIPNDIVDEISTMTPYMQYSKSGIGSWDDSWVSEPELVGSGENQLYVLTIHSPPNAEAGYYDTRVKWQDAAGQHSEWLETNNAFELKNALPRVLTNQDSDFAGIPAVKVETVEKVSLEGLVRDAETPLSQLSIQSNDPEFLGWDSAKSEITVRFSSIENDPSGNPIPQGVFITIGDDEDQNTGMLLFNVIENGAPRWSPVPTQPVFEGGSASVSLTPFLTDSDDDGNPISSSSLSLSVVSNDNEELVQVSVDGHTITATTVDKDSNGVAQVILDANDGAKSSQTTLVFYVINVNDPPTVDLSTLEGLTLRSGEQSSVDISTLMGDIDDPDDEIWVEVNTAVPGSVQFDHINGVLNMHWLEPGIHSVSLTLIDSHGDWSESHFEVSILDSKPITWNSDFQDGDFEPEIENLQVGENPIITINNLGPLQLSEIKTRWSICNSIVGICHSAGSVDGLGPFEAASFDGGGMSVGDYLTLSVKAKDSEGWDRETREILQILVPTTNEKPETIPSEADEINQEQQNGGEDTGFTTLEIIAGILILIVFIGGGALVGLYFSGYFGNPPMESKNALGGEQSYGTQTPSMVENHSIVHDQPQTEKDGVIDFENTEPDHPPIPEGGLPEGWSMEQWKYYGDQWIERNK